MKYFCLDFLSWPILTMMTSTGSLIAVILAVAVLIWNICKNWATPDSIVPKHINLDSLSKVDYYDHQTNMRIKSVDIERMFRDFKKSMIYARTVLYLINPHDDKPDLKELYKYLYENFFSFRQYLHSVAPKLIDTDIDYCILTLAGFKQKDMYRLMNNITQSGVRNIKPRLKEKLPANMYHDFFKINHEVY